MKALILVGGFGTRLRPLTLSIPKPLVPFAGLPMIIHQIKALKEVGVDEVVLAVAYQPELMKKEMEAWEKTLDIKITYSHETTPLGTAGPLALARSILNQGGEPFFVLNSDITCIYPLKDMIAFHKAHGNEGTIMVTKVDEPSKYGVVLYDDKGKISRFVEKPKEYVGNRINAGLYLFNPSILNRIEERPTSIEKEIFPQMANEGQLYAMDLPGHWMDIGQPKDFITGQALYLNSSAAKPLLSSSAGKDYQINGNVIIHPTATVGKGCVIGPNVVIDEGCKVGDGVRLANCSLFRNVTINGSSWLNRCIICWDCKIGRWCRVDAGAVLGQDVELRDEIFVNGASILPHKSISENITEPIVVM